MPQQASRNGMAPFTKLLLASSAVLSVAFWVGVISGKLHISFGLSHFPLISEVALAFVLGFALALGVGACLLEEKRRAESPPAYDTPTKGDM